MKIFESGCEKERAGKEKCPKKRKAPGGGRGHLSRVVQRERCPTMGTGQEKDWSWSLRSQRKTADRISMLNTSRSLILLAKMLFVSVCMIGVCLFDLLYFMSLTFLCCITKQNRNKIFQNIQSYLTQSHASLNSLSFLKSFFLTPIDFIFEVFISVSSLIALKQDPEISKAKTKWSFCQWKNEPSTRLFDLFQYEKALWQQTHIWSFKKVIFTSRYAALCGIL